MQIPARVWKSVENPVVSRFLSPKPVENPVDNVDSPVETRCICSFRGARMHRASANCSGFYEIAQNACPAVRFVIYCTKRFYANSREG